MSIFSSYKKIFLLGFIIVILVAIPFSVYIAQKRQNINSEATKSTALSFEPASTTVKVGDTVTLNIWLDPGSDPNTANQISFVKLSVSFDPSKFTTLPTDSLKENPESPNTLTVPVDAAQYDNASGKATLSLSIGADPTRAIKAKTKIAILKLKATAETTPTNSSITFDPVPATQVLSIASSDQTSENVLSTTSPATVVVAPANLTQTPSPNPTVTITVTPSPTPAGVGVPPSASLVPPVCSNLNISGPNSGTAPYSLTFTAVGNDSNGTISKISFNFGDSLEDLTAGGGIGTNSVNGQILHTYNTPGIYTAYAILTDNENNLSTQQDSCTKTITINSAGGIQPIPTLPPTGDGKIMVGLGTIGIIFTIIGGALLLL